MLPSCFLRVACSLLFIASSAGAAEGPVPLPAQPDLVGPGTVSGAFHDFAPALTPDGQTMMFTTTDAGFSRMTIMQSRLAGGKWQTPTVASFSGRWNDGDGTLSPDGSRYVFISNRPAQGEAAKADLDLWETARTADGKWGEPRRLPDFINTEVNEVYPSIASDGTLYFGRAGGDNPVFRSRLADGAYQPPERLPFNGFSFAISPDQRFGVLGVADAQRNFDLYLVTRQDGVWSAPRRLDGPVNSPATDLAAWISHDASTLYFVSTRRGPGESWPRARPVRSSQDVAAENLAIVHNGLRNIYKVDISSIVPR